MYQLKETDCHTYGSFVDATIQRESHYPYVESARRDLMGPQSTPVVGAGGVVHHPPGPMASTGYMPHALQQVGLPHYIPGITNHHILTVTTFNKDQVSAAP